MDRYRDEEAAAELTAALSAALPKERERMRAALTARVVADGEAMVRMAREGGAAHDEARTASTGPQLALASQATRNASRNATIESTTTNAVHAGRGIDAWRWTGWMAAAAAVLLWVIGPRVGEDRGAPAVERAPVVAQATVAELRAGVLRGDSTATPIRWAATTDSTAHGATGDVVWSDRLQRGVLRIAGLQPNDRARWQYQLWIFDKTRDARYPVDGGVFDVPRTGGDVLVPIATRLRVGNAVVFAVTVERAGGVVVSARDRIALLAQRGG